MRLIRKVILLIIFVLIGLYILIANNLIPQQVVDKVSHLLNKQIITLDKKLGKEIKHSEGLLEGDLIQWIGKSSDELIQELGEPVRQDLSAYGYTWWVYSDGVAEYIQFGMSNDHIQTIYVVGGDSSAESVFIGKQYGEINDQFPFAEQVNYRNGLSTYKFQLTTEDLLQRPLAKIGDDLFIQFYFDRFTNRLSSLRILTADTLLKHTPYEIEYRGDLPSKPILSEQDWLKVESGTEQQIFDISNVMRHRHQKSKLAWEEKVHEVAFLHSKDMSEHDYFSHEGLDGEGLKERLGKKNILYQAAGENIAAQYPDGPAAMEGWLNSEGHREALLADDFTHLGVGVYHLYYTQNFITKQ